MCRHLISFTVVTLLFGAAIVTVSARGADYDDEYSITWAVKLPGNQPVAPQSKTVCALPPSRKVDEYSNINPAVEKARLEKLVATLDAEPADTKAFIVAYAGRIAKPAEAQERAGRLKAAVREMHFFYNKGINTLDCGYRNEAAIEFWITPVGAAPPVCSPTINRSEVLIKPRVVRRAR